MSQTCAKRGHCTLGFDWKGPQTEVVYGLTATLHEIQ